jgi:hypothetical protein
VLVLIVMSAVMADRDEVAVGVVDDTPDHHVLVEFVSVGLDVDRQIEEMVTAVEWQIKWSMAFTLRDRSRLRVVGVAAEK